MQLLPIVGDLLAMFRLLGDRNAGLGPKALVVLAIAYVIMPFDLVPDAIPVITWLDDAGMLLALRFLLRRQLDYYRYPLGEKPPPKMVSGNEASSD